MLEKRNVDIRKTTKYKHTALVEDFNWELPKLLFKPMDAQELQEVSTYSVKNLNNIVNKINTINSLVIDNKPKDGIKPDSAHLDKHIQKKMYYLKMVYTDIYINLTNMMETKKMSERLYLE